MGNQFLPTQRARLNFSTLAAEKVYLILKVVLRLLVKRCFTVESARNLNEINNLNRKGTLWRFAIRKKFGL